MNIGYYVANIKVDKTIAYGTLNCQILLLDVRYVKLVVVSGVNEWIKGVLLYRKERTVI